MTTEEELQVLIIPTNQLGWNYTTWTKTKLRAILDHYITVYPADAAKIDLYEDLYHLIQHVSTTRGRTMDADDRRRILYLYGLGDPARFDRHIAEVIRYLWNFGSHDGKIHDFPGNFPYVIAMLKMVPVAKDAIRRSQFKAIKEDIQIYWDARRELKIKNLDDDNEFESVYNKTTRPQKSYTTEERDLFMRWALPYFRDRLYPGQKPMGPAEAEYTDNWDEALNDDEAGKNSDKVRVQRENLEEEGPEPTGNIEQLKISEENAISQNESFQVDDVSPTRKRKRSSSSDGESNPPPGATTFNIPSGGQHLGELHVAVNTNRPTIQDGPQITIELLQLLRQEASVIASAATNIATALSRLVDAPSSDSTSRPSEMD